MNGLRESACIGSRGETVIDYGIVNEEAWERVEQFRIGERAESDHLEIALRKRRRGKEQRRKRLEDRNKTVYFFGIGKPVRQNKAF
jgi:predicted DNA-binding WGR domain protein